ncbi:MAG: Ig-like domain-containing protein [Prevotella sp.]|nr:Ig-like domain-containing protein [Prevotella sp.]
MRTNNKNNESVTMSVEGDGTITDCSGATSGLADGKVTVTFEKSDQWYLVSLTLTGCTSSTRIRIKNIRTLYVDNVTVKGGADPRTPVTLKYSADKYTTAIEEGEITDADAPTLTVTPAEAASEVVFSSSDENVAYFDEDGKLIAVAPGTTTITASISGSETYRDNEDSYTLTVGLPSSNLKFNPESATVTYGDDFTAPKLSWANGYDKNLITFTSSNENVATVVNMDDDGKVNILIKSVGVTTIKASGAATQYLKASEAFFTLTVNDIQGSATGGTGAPVFKETFNNADSDGGNDGAFSKASNQQMNKDEVCDNIGWSGVMYKANKCIKTGTSSSTGSVTTPEISVEPNSPYSLSFKAAPWGTESNVMKVTVTGGTIGEGDIPTTNMTTGQWNEFTTTITPTSSTIKITFSVTGGKRFFLDEINVVAPATDNTVQVTIPSSGWGTYCCQWPLDFTAASAPEGLKAYAVSSTSTSNATLTEITEKIIGGTGIIINGTPGTTYTINVADQGAAYSGTNLLTGTLAPTYVEEGQYFLKSGRFVYSSAGILPENKAYLKKENAPEAAANFDFVVEDVTGISEVLNNISLDDDKWYDLSGRAVSPTSKGIYIHNGKKYVIK